MKARRIIIFLYCCGVSSAWTFSPLFSSRTASSTRLAVEQEKALRQEIAKRNTLVEDEEKYAVADGEFFDKLDSDETNQATLAVVQDVASAEVPSIQPKPVKTELEQKIERLTKPRAYPLFLAEKAAEFLEATVDDIAKGLNIGLSVGSSSSMTTPTNGAAVKERIVILGTGWGAASFLKEIDADLYDVTVISPRNYFLFTPMLAGSAVGTVEYRSITQPIREVNRKAKYLEATATDIDPKTNKVTCQSVVCDGNSCEIEDFEVEYDRLIVTVGAQTNTFGVKGVREH